MLEPIYKNDFLFRISKRYGFYFVIFEDSETILEFKESYEDNTREATGPELLMWAEIVPKDIRDKVNKFYRGGDSEIESTLEEIISSIQFKKIVYLSAEDFQILFKNRPQNIEFVNERNLLQAGHFASIDSTKIFVSREIPKGYYLSLQEPDPMLNWKPAEGEREIKPQLDSYKYNLQPLMIK